MKKILSLILTLFCVLSLVGCGRSMDDIIKNESSITGVVEEVYNNSILISIQTDAYPYGAYCDVSLDAENKDDMVDFNISVGGCLSNPKANTNASRETAPNAHLRQKSYQKNRIFSLQRFGQP